MLSFVVVVVLSLVAGNQFYSIIRFRLLPGLAWLNHLIKCYFTNGLIHLINFMSPCVGLGVPSEYFHIYRILHRNSCKQIV